MRLLTRADFDGLACAALLTEVGTVDEYKFVHPRQIQHGEIPVQRNDVLANVPYAEGCGLWFDHHSSERERLKIKNLNQIGESKKAPSAAQVIWDYYEGERFFGKVFNPLLKAVNKTDSADLRLDEILHAERWVLLYFIIDPRTGLEQSEKFRIDRSQFALDMIQYFRKMTVDEILKVPDVQERVERYNENQIYYKEMLRRCTTIKRNVIVTNLLEEPNLFCGNRFITYARNKSQNIEIRIAWNDDQKSQVIFNCGHSILNRTSKTDVGKLMLKFGGGGHARVGSCAVPKSEWEMVYKQLLTKMIRDG